MNDAVSAGQFIPDHLRLRSEGPVNALTVDVEDYFQVSAFEDTVAGDDWSRLESRVSQNLDRIQQLFADHGVTGTFFTLGWIAERFPREVRALVDNGHEVASHGYSHRLVSSQSRNEFLNDVTRTRKLLQDVTGQAIRGYRAASYSIGADNLWALDVLAEVGHEYSSSIYPIRHDTYGMEDAPRFAFRVHNASGLLEIPVSTVNLLGRNFPCGGGGYFRLLPYAISKRAIRSVNAKEHQPTVFYFHPWEIDPEQPRIEGAGWKSRFRHYVNLDKMEGKLVRLLKDFRWDRMDRIFLDRNIIGAQDGRNNGTES